MFRKKDKEIKKDAKGIEPKKLTEEQQLLILLKKKQAKVMREINELLTKNNLQLIVNHNISIVPK